MSFFVTPETFLFWKRFLKTVFVVIWNLPFSKIYLIDYMHWILIIFACESSVSNFIISKTSEFAGKKSQLHKQYHIWIFPSSLLTMNLAICYHKTWLRFCLRDAWIINTNLMRKSQLIRTKTIFFPPQMLAESRLKQSLLIQLFLLEILFYYHYWKFTPTKTESWFFLIFIQS